VADLRAWRDAAHDLPPEGVPVWMMDGDGTVSIFETFRDDDGAACWSTCDYSPWWSGLALNPSWHSASAHYEGDRVARYWHPLPDVPTLAELDGVLGGSVTWATEGGDDGHPE
jgi:hypothetical protein